MKKNKATADTIVGFFVIVGIILINVVTIVIRQDVLGRQVRVEATFESVSGLEVGAPVLVSGIRAGRVTGISYQPGEDGIPDPELLEAGGILPQQPVLVRMVVKDTVPIYTNARVRLVQQGFIGDRRVEIDPGSPEYGEPYHHELPPLRGTQPPDLEMAFAQASTIVDDLQATVQSFRMFITDDENITLIRETIENLDASVQKVQDYLETNEENVAAMIEEMAAASKNAREVSERINRMLAEDGEVQAIVGDVRATVTQTRSDVERILERAQTTVDNVNEVVTRMDERADRLTGSATTMMDSATVDIAELRATLEETSNNLNEVITRVRQGEGTVGRLLTDPTPFENLKRSTEALEQFLRGSGPRYGTRPLDYTPRQPPLDTGTP